MTEQRFPKSLRLLTGEQFQLVFDQKCSTADSMLVVYARPNGLSASRLGLVVSRKVGNAVVRNRWKRHIRNAFRTQQAEWSESLDLVVLPRRNARPSATPIASSLDALVRRISRRVSPHPAPPADGTS